RTGRPRPAAAGRLTGRFRSDRSETADQNPPGLCPFAVESARFLAQPSAPYRPGLLRRYVPRKDENGLRRVLDRPLTSSLRAAEGGAAIQGCEQAFGNSTAHGAPCGPHST